jgi:hypothetical protein
MMIRVKKMYFTAFLKVVIVDQDTLVTALIPQSKDSGKLIFSDCLQDSYPASLEAVLGQREASHLWGNIL